MCQSTPVYKPHDNFLCRKATTLFSGKMLNLSYCRRFGLLLPTEGKCEKSAIIIFSPKGRHLSLTGQYDNIRAYKGDERIWTKNT